MWSLNKGFFDINTNQSILSHNTKKCSDLKPKKKLSIKSKRCDANDNDDFISSAYNRNIKSFGSREKQLFKSNKIESPNKEESKRIRIQNNEIPENDHSSISCSDRKANDESVKSNFDSEDRFDQDKYEIFLNQQTENLENKATISVLGDNIHQERIENNIIQGSQTFLQIKLKHRINTSNDEDFSCSNILRQNHGTVITSIFS